jgi:hypothetical protein
MVLAAGAGEPPGLGMPLPEDRRRILITSAISALVHVLVIGGIALVGYIAQQAVEEIIPVRIFNEPIELPGSSEPARLPVPKMLSAPMASAVPLSIDPLDLAAVPAPMLEAPSLDLITPTAINLAEVLSAPLATRVDIQPTPSAADISEIQPLDINAADLVAPKVDLSGPTQAPISTTANLAAPLAFENLSELNAAQYKGAASTLPHTTGPTESGGALVATGVPADFISTGFKGGDPNAPATVDCLNSAFVHRYKNEIVRRTKARWEVPLDADPADFVKLRIAIDHSGAVALLEMVESSAVPFAESALMAFKSAAPFPPLNDNNRCLAKEIFILNFANPEQP